MLMCVFLMTDLDKGVIKSITSHCLSKRKYKNILARTKRVHFDALRKQQEHAKDKIFLETINPS